MTDILGLVFVFTFTVLCLVGVGLIIYDKEIKND